MQDLKRPEKKYIQNQPGNFKNTDGYTVTQEFEEMDKDKKTLHLTIKLDNIIGHRLQRFKSVCGYGLSMIFRKYQVKMLTNSNEQSEIENFLKLVMQNETDMKSKNVCNLVVFVVIEALPEMIPDQYNLVEIMDPSEKKGSKTDDRKFQSVGPMFEIEGEDGLFISTSTHGKDMSKCSFKVYLKGIEAIRAVYWDSIYISPKGADDGLTPSKVNLGEVKEIHRSVDIPQGSDQSWLDQGATDMSDVSNIKNSTDEVSPLAEDGAACQSPKTRDAKNTKPSQSARGTPDAKAFASTEVCRNIPTPSGVSLADSGFESRGSSSLSFGSPLSEDDHSEMPSCTSTPISRNPGVTKRLEEMTLNLESPIKREPDFEQGEDITSGTEPHESHVDLCLLKVEFGKVEESFSKLKQSSHLLVKDIKKEEDNVRSEKKMVGEKLRKHGFKTGESIGKVVEWYQSIRCILKKERVWMHNMIVTEQLHDYKAKISPEEVPYKTLVLIPSVKDSDTVDPNMAGGGAEAGATGGQPIGEDLSAFVDQGDSGALFTTMPSAKENVVQAVSTNLYHFETDGNVYLKKLRYSLSAPLDPSVRALEAKIKKKMILKEMPILKS